MGSFREDLERDWGNPEIYGPWTAELEKNNPPAEPGTFKFYKSYYFITYSRNENKPAKIKPFNTENYENRRNRNWKNIFLRFRKFISR